MLKLKDGTHAWPATAEEAAIIQDDLRDRTRIRDEFDPISVIAGIDVSYDPASNLTHAFVVLINAETLHPISHVVASTPTRFPYIPGFLSFREIPAILMALAKLKVKPDLLMVDGQGIAHPKGLGIAAHLGVLTDMPSIGVAKSRLVGIYEEPANEKGAMSKLRYHDKVIGTVLRSKMNTKPLFISPGHRVSLETATNIVLKTLTKYRLPEPTRLADKLSKMEKPKAA